MKLRTHAQSSHANALRLSLLVSLGLLPVVACGGSAVTQGDANAGGPSAGASGAEAGAPSTGGALTAAGAPSRGGSSPTVAGSTGNPHCDEPVTDPVSGLVSCKQGFSHRPQARTCAAPETGAAGAAGALDAPDESPSPTSCKSDADCTAFPLGYCAPPMPSLPGLSGSCRSGCLQDVDCGENQLCVCDGSATGGKCVSGGCRIDSECGAGAYCASAGVICESVFACTSVKDECLGNNDCPNGFCYAAGHRSCTPIGVCGRPFLIEDAPRFAEVTPRTDWLDTSLSPSLIGLSPLQRAELAAHWSRLGQMEHASIAAFARFNLQLLALGAPADLVEACNQALVDETAHAKLCFAFASAYAGTKLGPSKLDMSHCFEETSLVSVAKLVISEGCIGETVAALEALEDAEKATDPVVKNALLRIAHDERNHAELAYRFVRWALTQCSDDERSELMHEAEQRVTSFENSAREEPRVASQRVVRPLLDALVANV